MEEVIANALVAYVRLVELKKTAVAHPRDGLGEVRRRPGLRWQPGRKPLERSRGLVPIRPARKGFIVERLDHFDKEEDAWMEAVVEDHQTPVADQVAFRLDFPAWLRTQSRRNRRIAETLAIGHSTTQVAKRFHVSAGRISQKRQEFHKSWQEFRGEVPPENKAA